MGVSDRAYVYYEEIIKNFSQAEIVIMLALPDSNTTVGQRIKNHARCKSAFKNIVSLVDSTSIPTKSKRSYKKWKNDD